MLLLLAGMHFGLLAAPPPDAGAWKSRLAAEIAAEVADAFFAMADLDRRLEILERSRERLRTTAASATERYRVGKGTQSDVLRANLQTTALEERFITLKSERRMWTARFNALLKLPV